MKTHTFRRWTVRGLGLAALATLALAFSTAPAAADVDADLRAGLYMDAEAFAVGGGILTNVSDSHHWFFNPNVELAFADGTDLYTVNGDFHYDLANESGATFWLGAGPALLIQDREIGDSDTDFGVNLFGGIGALRGEVRPFAQVKGIVADNSEVALTGGIRF